MYMVIFCWTSIAQHRWTMPRQALLARGEPWHMGAAWPFTMCTQLLITEVAFGPNGKNNC